MSFKEAIELALKGCKIRRDWWREGHYIELKDNGFVDEEGIEYFVDMYGSNWELYIELWEE